MRIHFIAIGGTIMHNLAISLAEYGHQVSGSDDQIVEPSRSKLKAANIFPEEMGWFSEKITDDLDAVILGMHAKPDNPELLRAQELAIRIYSFPEFIYEQSIDKTRIVIGGTYGKTTMMSMVMHVLKKQSIDFDYLVNAQLKGYDSMIKITPNNKYILIEGDEFDASPIDHRSKFEIYKPYIALISGVEWNSFKTDIDEEDYYKRFEDFIRSIEPKGTLIYNKENLQLVEIADRTRDYKINRHGYNLPQYTINKGVTYLHVDDHDVPLKIIGKHNLSNIAGAQTVCEWMGVKRNEFFESIQDFESSIRYLEFVASNNGNVVYQDFAHTVPKLKSSIRAIKEQFPEQSLLTILELNRYEAMEPNFLSQYKESMKETEHAIIYIDKYDSEETETQQLIGNLTRTFKHADLQVIIDQGALIRFLNAFDSEGCNLLLMSSFNFADLNISELADSFLKKN